MTRSSAQGFGGPHDDQALRHRKSFGVDNRDFLFRDFAGGLAAETPSAAQPRREAENKDGIVKSRKEREEVLHHGHRRLGALGVFAPGFEQRVKLIRCDGQLIEVLGGPKRQVERDNVDLVLVNELRRQVAGGIRDQGNRRFPAVAGLVLAAHVVHFDLDGRAHVLQLIE